MKITINPFDKRSVRESIKELKNYSKSLERKHKTFIERLTNLGVKEVELKYGTVHYDGEKDAHVYKEKTDSGVLIIAEGQAVAFLEFGAGVHINAGQTYPLPKPSGIVELGEYGKGYGKRRAWFFKGENGEIIKTRGNPMSMGLYYGSETMKNNILKIAREVYGS